MSDTLSDFEPGFDPDFAEKTTIESPSNIAFIKYWGARDLAQVIPENTSLSMTLSVCVSRCTVEHVIGEGDAHDVRWRGADGGLELAPPSFAQRVRAHLDLLRDWSGCGGHFRLATENTFPSAAGLASSASGFSAVTLAVLGALGREVSEAMESDLARRSGSGSASRSVFGGYVEWPADGFEDGDPTCHAKQIARHDWWDLRDVVAVVESGPKAVSSLDGHKLARTSPYFETRLAELPGRLAAVKQALKDRDFARLGPVIEAEAIDLHCIAMTSTPAIFYWKPATLTVLERVRRLRADGVPAYATMDAGANVHVICPPAAEDAVEAALRETPGVEQVLLDGVGEGPRATDKHLF